MIAERTFMVREFARLAGVTVRTLHYYDAVGLLTPSRRTRAGHRLYQPGDFVRLQQILTLKWIGFSLDEVQHILTSPSYDLKRSLRIQKDAIDREIARLQGVARALEQTLAALDSAEGEPVAWEVFQTMTQGMIPPDHREWLRRYYSEEQLDGFEARQIAPEQLLEWNAQWADLMTAFQAAQGEAPDSPTVQALAAQMFGLVRLFTQGDPAIRAAMERLWDERDQMPAEAQAVDADLLTFMNSALAVYEQNRGEKA
jgi:DNA-binding transcriptional MerR regulator